MQIDIAKLKTDGQQYVDTIVEKAKEQNWTDLKLSKFQNVPPEQLNIMKILWSHGFMKGAETAAELTATLYEELNKKENK